MLASVCVARLRSSMYINNVLVAAEIGALNVYQPDGHGPAMVGDFLS